MRIIRVTARFRSGYRTIQERLRSIRIKRATARKGKTLSMVFSPASKKGLLQIVSTFFRQT
jgi:hypothetical protein